MLSGKRVTLLIGGSIAAYKAAELVRLLVKRGANVQVAMTDAAKEFITPLSLQTLSGHAVHSDLFDEITEAQIGHIKLADNTDVVVVAPATADLIAKAASGIADDICSCILLATRAPVLFAPAMNVNMWEHPRTQANIERLKSDGARFIDPDEGELACGWLGRGRLTEVSQIVEEIEFLCSDKSLAGSRVIVTAGSTREHFDPIRFVSNRSSGKMGYAIAKNAQLRGAEVILISGPTMLEPPRNVDCIKVETGLEMKERLTEVLEHPLADSEESNPTQFLFMVAAVPDYRPAEMSATKLKQDKKSDFCPRLVPNPDILLEIGEDRARIAEKSGRNFKLIGFAAETGEEEEELIAWARAKLNKKNADLIVGNFVDDSFEKDTNRVWLLDRTGRQEQIATADKELIARKIISAALRI